MKEILVYLDNCCYNRPYDDQSQIRISLESQAKLEIQRRIKKGEIKLITSYMTEYENAQNPIETRRRNIEQFQKENSYVYVKETVDKKVQMLVPEIEKTGIKHKDACHVICAKIARADYLITTDDRLLKCQTEGITLMTPVDFLKELEADEDADEYK